MVETKGKKETVKGKEGVFNGDTYDKCRALLRKRGKETSIKI